jgi:hypothetical protein
MPAHGAQHRAGNTHPPYYCDDCGRTHDGRADDIRALLLWRGVILGDVAYTFHVHPDGSACALAPVLWSREGARGRDASDSVRLRWYAREGVRLPSCERCGRERSDHDATDGACEGFRAERGALADTLRVRRGRGALLIASRMRARAPFDARPGTPSALPCVRPVATRTTVLTAATRAALRSADATMPHDAAWWAHRAHERADARMRANDRAMTYAWRAHDRNGR